MTRTYYTFGFFVTIVMIGQSRGHCNGFGINSNMDISSGSHDISTYSGNPGATELGECCIHCQNNPECKAFVWNQVWKQCFLKDVTGPTMASPKFGIGGFKDTSGVEFWSQNAQCAQVTSGFDIAPGTQYDLKSFPETDLATCCSECNKNQECRSFIWSQGSGSCWLKNADSPTVPNSDRVSGLPLRSSQKFDDEDEESKESNDKIKLKSHSEQCASITSGYDIAPGSQYDLMSFSRVDLDTCCDECNKDHECRAFIWSQGSKSCWLKNVDSPKVPNSDRVSGLPLKPRSKERVNTNIPRINLQTLSGKCDSVNSGYDISPGTEYDLVSYPQTDLTTCCDKCNKNPECRAFVWSQGSGLCWLKNVDSPTVPNSDRISGLPLQNGEIQQYSPPITTMNRNPKPKPEITVNSDELGLEEGILNKICDEFDVCSKNNPRIMECCKFQGFRSGECIFGIAFCYE